MRCQAFTVSPCSICSAEQRLWEQLEYALGHKDDAYATLVEWRLTSFYAAYHNHVSNALPQEA